MSISSRRLLVLASWAWVLGASCGPSTGGSDATADGATADGAAGTAAAGTGGPMRGMAGAAGTAGMPAVADASDDVDGPQDIADDITSDAPATTSDANVDVAADVPAHDASDGPAQDASDGPAGDGPKPDASPTTDAVEAPADPCATAATGATCGGGHCCAGRCVANDVHACGATCAACSTVNGTPSCDGSSCSIACTDGFQDCDATAPGCETDIRTDKNHCGNCGKVCAASPGTTVSCAARACVSACTAGLGDCDEGAKHDGSDASGCETHLNTTLNCGACGAVCSRANTVPSCGASGNTVACSYACAPGYKDCDGNGANGCEVDVLTDNLNCGKCQTKTATNDDIQNPDAWCAAQLNDAVGTCKLWLGDRCLGGQCVNCQGDFSSTPPADYCTTYPDAACVYDADNNGLPVACNGGCVDASGCASAFSCPP